jgi:poly(hydroxyalkanoate) depolymerase family esterase
MPRHVECNSSREEVTMRLSRLAFVAVLTAAGVAHAQLTPVADFGSNPGALKMYEYVPAGLPSGRPLVIVLHGCTQTAAAMMNAGWNDLADQYKFAVVYPEQESANNPVECFNWAGEYGDPADITRGMGENQSIMSMIDDAISKHGSDPHKVYIVGFSAGAAFTAVMLATWPEKFAAGAIESGVAYRCATSVNGAYSCQNPGVTKTPQEWGDLARMGDGSFGGPWPRVQIWHGSMDTIVATMNEGELVKQWTNVWGTDQTADETEMIGMHKREAYKANGTIVVESYLISGMGHATVVGNDPEGMCPGKTGSYFEDHGICSTTRIAAFFGLPNGGNPGGGSDGGNNGGDDDGGTGPNHNGGFGCSATGAAASLPFVALALMGMFRAARRRMRITLPFVVVAALVAGTGTANATLTEVTSFGSNPGALKMFEYVPAGLPAGSPLVVVLHGCTQTAAAMENAGWNALADQYKFAVLYPEQESANNPVTCFNWAGEYGDPADLVRGQGENQSIMSMIDKEIASHGVDTHKVYMAGFSAGGAFAAVMLATWPERFAGVSINSGLPYRCATSVAGAYSCQSPGVTKTAPQWGDLARMGDSAFAGPWPKIQMWHGTSDSTVVPMNMGELVKQWTNVLGIDATADETETIGQATRTAYKSGSNIVLETYSIQGMGHAVSVGNDPAGTCTAHTASFFEDHGICATLRQAKFFGLTGGGGTTTGGPPTVAFVAPTDGESVSGQLTVVVAANSDAGVASVDLAIDGAAVGTSTTAPYQFNWDATAAGTGSHTLVATAHDVNGMTAMASIGVTVSADGGGNNNGGGDDDSGGSSGTGSLPACSLDAGGKGARGWLPIAAAIAIVVCVRRRRR